MTLTLGDVGCGAGRRVDMAELSLSAFLVSALLLEMTQQLCKECPGTWGLGARVGTSVARVLP